MRRLHFAGLTLLALAVPTFAFGGEQAPSGPQSLAVSASLDGCGLAEATIVCRIETGWNAIDDADYYSVSVTRPDGSVLELGQGQGTGRTVYVPYVGSGSYSIQVSAWGTPSGEEEAVALASDRATSAEVVGESSRGEASRAGDGREPEQEVPQAQDEDEEPEPAGSDDEGSETPAECPGADRKPGEAKGERDESEEDAASAPAADPKPKHGEQYDPADADGNGGCPLHASP